MDEQRVVEDIVEKEGGPKFTNRRADLGGPTFMGMTWETYARLGRKFGKWKPLDKAEFTRTARFAVADPDHPMRANVRLGYRLEYIEPYRGLPKGLRWAITDLGVNVGPPRASRILQDVVDAPQDGVVGPITLRRARDLWRTGKAARVEALVAVADARLDWYIRLARRKPNQMANLRGWKNRTMSVLQESLEAC